MKAPETPVSTLWHWMPAGHGRDNSWRIKRRKKETILSKRYCPRPGYWVEHPLRKEIASGSFKEKNPPKIEGRGYVVKSLETALWISQ